ncbi:MAG: hypothetical protein F4X18_00960 [Acidimicrobiia bacterium]|nr:hypothetical protein [Acidimicrobiia bacterium]MYC84074.1 hypothetical protein [Acidimicrobiia bacterium]
MSVRRNFRRAYVAIGGGLLVILGLAGFALPLLPGTVLLVAGLLVWSSEFRWAREVLARVRAWLADRTAKRRDKS